jgi:hypothetical protein
LTGVPRPEVGDIDIVTSELELNGDIYYSLQRFDYDLMYLAKLFAVLPDEDGDEIEDTEKEAIVPAPALYGNEHTH